MPMYTPAETKIINAAWSAVHSFLENRSTGATYDLDKLAKAERTASYSPTLGHWSPTECHLYVMREFGRGMAGRDAPIKPSEFSGHRSPLILAFMMGNDVWVRFGARSGDELDVIAGKIAAAVEVHEIALKRFLARTS